MRRKTHHPQFLGGSLARPGQGQRGQEQRAHRYCTPLKLARSAIPDLIRDLRDET
jgi:hypothetical protein